MADEEPQVRLTFRLTTNLREQIEVAAREAGQTMTVWIIRACMSKVGKAGKRHVSS